MIRGQDLVLIVTLLAALIGVALVYFIPAIIADRRDHENATAIFWLNLLTGWSIVGWVAAFIWACVATSREEEERVPCPYCAEEIRPEATLCPHCRSDLTKSAAWRAAEVLRRARPG